MDVAHRWHTLLSFLHVVFPLTFVPMFGIASGASTFASRGFECHERCIVAASFCGHTRTPSGGRCKQHARLVSDHGAAPLTPPITLLLLAAGNAPLRWSRYVWRRGTVPIWWGVEMKNGGLGDVDVVIAANNPYQGTKRCASGPFTSPRVVLGHH